MDCSAKDHSDSDSGDSWTLIENNSKYADDAPDTADLPTESSTPENQEKDEDTDGISIITDSEPESSSPCQISYEHYLSEENSTTEHPIPQFITVNSELHGINHHEPTREDDDFLEESGGKHKTYVHRRNKRLSTVLNIIMLGSVITAAGIAIGHMWGAKTDCSMHSPTSINKILSNLYKLQEENAYLWSKLKELRALNNYQMNQQKATLKQNKCKKMFEEPLINNDSKKVTKCLDDKFVNYDSHNIISSHMAEAAKKEDEFLNETGDLTKERKSYADSLKYFEKAKTYDVKENQVFKPGNKYLNENNNILQRPYASETDSSFHDKNKQTEENGREINLSSKGKNRNIDSNQLKGEPILLDEYTSNEIHQNIKKRENNKTFKKEEFARSVKDKNRKKNNKSLNNRSPKGEYDSEEGFRNMEYEYLKNAKIENAIVESSSKNVKDKNLNNEKKKDSIEDKILKENKRGSKNGVKTESKDFDRNKTAKDENGAENIVIKIEKNGLNGNKKVNEDYEYQIDGSDEDITKDNRYTSQKQKPERKKYDRKQLYKKNKKRNKYEQWEMKGGLFKDYDEIPLTSFQDKEHLFNKPNLMNDKVDMRQLRDKYVDNIIGTTDNLKHGPEYIKINEDMEDEINWLDIRARLRTEARQKFKQESFDKNDVNAAGWYFRRMRKREQSRGKGDNTTYRKLKRNIYDF